MVHNNYQYQYFQLNILWKLLFLLILQLPAEHLITLCANSFASHVPREVSITVPTLRMGKVTQWQVLSHAQDHADSEQHDLALSACA